MRKLSLFSHNFFVSGKARLWIKNWREAYGTSKVSWKDAIVQTIAEASKTIDYLTGVTVVNQKAKINGDKITEYYVDIDLTFMIDRDRK